MAISVTGVFEPFPSYCRCWLPKSLMLLLMFIAGKSEQNWTSCLPLATERSGCTKSASENWITTDCMENQISFAKNIRKLRWRKKLLFHYYHPVALIRTKNWCQVIVKTELTSTILLSVFRGIPQILNFWKLSFLMIFWKSELCAPLWLLWLFSGPLLRYLWPFLGSENLPQCQLALITQKFFIKFKHFDVTQILIHPCSVKVSENSNNW